MGWVPGLNEDKINTLGFEHCDFVRCFASPQLWTRRSDELHTQ